MLITILVVWRCHRPDLGHLAARWPYRRSIPVLSIVAATAVAWTVVLAWPGRAPFALLVVLVVVLASNGPGSLMGFDYARTENEAERSARPPASSTSVVRRVTADDRVHRRDPDLRSSGGPSSYTLGDFRLAFSVQYLFWGIGLSASCTTAGACGRPAA